MCGIRNLRSRKFKIGSIAVASLVLSLFGSPAHSAYTVAPKYRQCFNHSKVDVFAPSPLKNPVSCSKIHTAEIYYVGTWPSSTPPWALSDSDALDIAASVCNNTPALNYFTDYFNYWAWFTPSQSAWKKGERWLRCDAMFVTNISTAKTSNDYRFKSWTGARL